MDTVTDAEIVQWWEERSAIMEFDGGHGRENAEKVAAIRARKLFGRVPLVVMEVVRNQSS